jgi:hypothetical protein
MNIELVEALCGFQRVIKTLDDRDLVITAIPGEFCFQKERLSHYEEEIHV